MNRDLTDKLEELVSALPFPHGTALAQNPMRGNRGGAADNGGALFVVRSLSSHLSSVQVHAFARGALRDRAEVAGVSKIRNGAGGVTRGHKIRLHLSSGVIGDSVMEPLQKALRCDVREVVGKDVPKLASKPVDGQVVVGTWNVNSLRNKLRIARVHVANYRPDVFCLQETSFDVERSALRWPGYVCSALSPSDEVGNRGLAVCVRQDSGWHSVRIMPHLKTSLVVELTGMSKPSPQQGSRVLRWVMVCTYVNPLPRRKLS